MKKLFIKRFELCFLGYGIRIQFFNYINHTGHTTTYLKTKRKEVRA